MTTTTFDCVNCDNEFKAGDISAWIEYNCILRYECPRCKHDNCLVFKNISRSRTATASVKDTLIDMVEETMDDSAASFLLKHLLKENMIIRDKGGDYIWIRVTNSRQKKLIRDSTLIK